MQKPSDTSLRKLRALAIDIAGEAPVRITISGNSMRPTLHSGDAVFLAASKKAKPVKGEIITFIQEEALMTHRVLAVRPDHLLTKGDNVRALDPPVPSDQVLGVAVARERNDAMRPISAGAAARWTATLSRMEGELHQRAAQTRLYRFRIVRGGIHRPIRLAIATISRLFGG